MGESAAASDGDQQAKRAAAAAYDYEGDSRWAEYWSNVLVPPHLAGRPGVDDHFKRKFYQRYVDPDLVVESISSLGSSQTKSAPRSSSTASSGDSTRSRDSAPQTGSARATRSSSQQQQDSTTTSALRLDGRTINFSINAWVLVVAVLAVIPILPKSISSKSYRLSLLGTIFSGLFSVYSVYGKPRAWNMQAIQIWLQSVIGSKDFLHAMFCLMFLTSRLHLKMALIPVLCWGVDHVARFLRRNFARSPLYRKYLDAPCQWVESNNTTLNILCSNVEIALGFLLIISLFSWQRNIIQTFMYWQILKLMSRAPVTANYHQSVWARIGRTVNPLVSQHAPFLGTPISAIQRWWHN